MEPVATSDVIDPMTVIFCEHKNNSGGVLQILTLNFHILLLVIYFYGKGVLKIAADLVK